MYRYCVGVGDEFHVFFVFIVRKNALGYPLSRKFCGLQNFSFSVFIFSTPKDTDLLIRSGITEINRTILFFDLVVKRRIQKFLPGIEPPTEQVLACHHRHSFDI